MSRRGGREGRGGGEQREKREGGVSSGRGGRGVSRRGGRGGSSVQHNTMDNSCCITLPHSHAPKWNASDCSRTGCCSLLHCTSVCVSVDAGDSLP